MLRLLRIHLSRFSLRTQYIFFAGIVSWLVVLALLWVSYSTYEEFRKAYTEDVKLHTQEVQHVFDEKISFVEHFLQFIGLQIQNSGAVGNPEVIANIIKNHRHDTANADSGIIWNIVNFVTKNGYIVVDSVTGVHNKPIKLPADRMWRQDAQDDPWKLKFSAPSTDVVTHDYIVPSGIGVEDEKTRNFFGFLSCGISIERLLSSMLKLIDEHIVFAMFDDEFNLVLVSDPFIDEDVISAKIRHNRGLLTHYRDYKNPVELQQYMVVDAFVFSHYVHSTKFPYWFLMGYSQSYYSNEIWSEIAPKISINIALWCLFTSILVYLSYQVVRPIVILGSAADDVSYGKDIRVPRFAAPELRLLGRQLETIAKIQANYKLKQEQLTYANQQLSAANEFIRGNMSFLSHELINPTASIVEFARMLRSRTSVYPSEDADYINIMHDAALHLNKQLNFFMKMFRFQTERKIMESRVVQLKQLVEWNLSMMIHHARYKQVRITSDVQPPHLAMLGDEIMIGQLVQNIAANGAKYNKIGGELIIRVFVNAQGGVEFHFIDSGIGIKPEELQEIFKIFKRSSNVAESQEVGYGIGLAYAQSCTSAHGGTIEVESELGKGSIFKVIFPVERTVLQGI
jgi:signal transduction histidine kinase